MNAAKWWNENTKKWTRRLALPVLAVALAASFGTYECIKPAAARAAEAAPAAAPLDADSVGALMALDKAMETLAARVTPAVVNVTVTSRTKPDNASQQIPKTCSSSSAAKAVHSDSSSDRTCSSARARRSSMAWAAAS